MTAAPLFCLPQAKLADRNQTGPALMLMCPDRSPTSLDTGVRPGKRASLLVLLLLAGCTTHQPSRPAPPRQAFDGLLVSGSLADALHGGFGGCIADETSMRCLRPGVMFEGQGPYNAAVDLVGSDGSGGFDQVTLWHEDDQGAVLAVGDALERQGWQSCLTGEGNRGDLEIYTRAGVPVRIAIDASYWGKRRLRIIPDSNAQKPRCR